MSNRVIKFRGYCHKDSEWRCGYYVSDGKHHEILTRLSSGEMYASQIDPESLGQFTCLHDCKGVEIYEGDIIRMEGGSCYDMVDPGPSTRQVMWCNDTGALTHFRIDGKPSGSGLTWCRDNAEKCFSVIGNIYETPELLEFDA